MSRCAGCAACPRTMPPVRLKIRSAALDANLDQPFDIDEPDHLFAGCSSSGRGWSAWWPVLTSLCWLARYSQVIALAAALLAGLPGKNSATPAMFARDWQIFKFIVAHDFIPTNSPTTSFKISQDCDRLEVSDFGSVRCGPTCQKRRRRQRLLTMKCQHC